MKRILVTGAGGSPATNFVRSLRKAPEDFYIVGTDADKYCLQRAETDARFLVPAAEDPQYLPILIRIITDEGIEFVHAQNDLEVNVLSENRDVLRARTFLPDRATVRLCQDKYGSFCRWRDAGLKVPDTMLIRTRTDLEAAFEAYEGRVWIRATSGAGGRGSLPVRDIETAVSWLDLQRGWDGTFTASELLEDKSITWMSLWHQGELVVAQGRRRLYWELARVSPSGITGATGAGETVSDRVLDEIAQRAVLAIDARPNGLFGVDLSYDADGVPNPTEINIGRFFTTHQFFTELGVNMPYAFVQLSYGEDPGSIARGLNPAPDKMVWIRGIDFEPVLVPREEIDRQVRMLDDLRRQVS